MTSPVVRVRRNCPAGDSGCCCTGACEELMDVVRARDYWAVVGERDEARRGSYYAGVADALDALRAIDFPLTDRVDLLAEALAPKPRNDNQ